MRFLRTTSVLAAALLFWIASPPPCQATDRCGHTADKLLFRVKSWSDVRKWFESYADCDDGDLAEGLDDYVTVSLAKHWKDLPKLKRELEKNPRLEPFVLRHIGSSANADDTEAALRNATHRCPRNLTRLCSSIATAARESLGEGRKHNQASPPHSP